MMEEYEVMLSKEEIEFVGNVLGEAALLETSKDIKMIKDDLARLFWDKLERIQEEEAERRSWPLMGAGYENNPSQLEGNLKLDPERR